MADTETQQDEMTAAPQLPQLPPLDMSWAKAPTERPPRPKIGKDGFTLALADYGTYGIAPDHWPYENDTPRGAHPSPDMGLPAPYTIYNKAEVWAENCAELYEAGIRDQWKPSTGIAWTTLEALPEHIELSIDQIVSNISEQSYNSNQVLMGWLREISYGYHEVKLYLATQTFDHARHVEAFRKRALANGGGLGVQTPGFFNRAVYASFKFTELVVYVNIIRTSFLLALCENGDKIARSQADRELFENTASDLRRHLSYGIEHLKFYVQADHHRRSNVRNWLERGEIMLGADLKRDTALREACILAMGDSVVAGKAALKALREAQLKKYLLTLEAATIYDREGHVNRTLQDMIDNP